MGIEHKEDELKIIGAWNGRDKECTIATKDSFVKTRGETLSEAVKRYIDTRGV